MGLLAAEMTAVMGRDPGELYQSLTHDFGEAAEIALAAGAVERVGLPGGSLWSHADVISASESRCTVRVVPTNEDLMIVRHTRKLLFSTFPPASDATTEEALR